MAEAPPAPDLVPGISLGKGDGGGKGGGKGGGSDGGKGGGKGGGSSERTDSHREQAGALWTNIHFLLPVHLDGAGGRATARAGGCVPQGRAACRRTSSPTSPSSG